MVKLTEYPHISFQKDWQMSEQANFQLGQCESMIKVISALPMEPEYRKKLYLVSLKKGARSTTAIEGNTLSEVEVEKIQNGESLPPSKEYLETEVKNILVALGKIRDGVIFDKADSLITPELILSFHKMVGMELGERFQAIPGRFREGSHNVVVGKYRAPDARQVKGLIESFCNWLRVEFDYESGGQTFANKIIEAIVCHVYLAWIHPFGDGNGRTARLIEFYLLLRAGLPDIASHILSNYYNDTREEYYRQLDLATNNRSLNDFISYAVLGFRDGLSEVLNEVLNCQLETAWKNHIFSTLDSGKVSGKTKAVVKRQRTLILNMPFNEAKSIDELLNTSAPIIKEYGQLSKLTINRDMDELINLGLVIKSEKKYQPNFTILKRALPLKK